MTKIKTFYKTDTWCTSLEWYLSFFHVVNSSLHHLQGNTLVKLWALTCPGSYKTFKVHRLQVLVKKQTFSRYHDTQHNNIQHNSIECHYAECRDFFYVMLNVIILYVIMLNVVMHSVVAPFSH
jgi:hypothetical protein